MKEYASKTFTAEELGQFNGKAGKPAYIAYNGKVYDVTKSDLWTNGEHQESHEAGKDLTAELADAPHMDEVFRNFPVVGVLNK